jgi:ferredoxin
LVALSLIGIDPKRVSTVVAAKERGLSAEEGGIQLVGQPPADLAIKDFLVPKTGEISWFRGRLPRLVDDYLTGLLRPKPVFLDDVCIGCADCFRHCPPKAITMQGRRPAVDLASCIRCFCCQELCPHRAVEIHRPWLAQKLLDRLG